MNFQKSLDNLQNRLARAVDTIDIEKALRAIGLQFNKPGFGPIVASFGAGLLVGMGAALMLTPVTGKELRMKVGKLFQSGKPILSGALAMATDAIHTPGPASQAGQAGPPVPESTLGDPPRTRPSPIGTNTHPKGPRGSDPVPAT